METRDYEAELRAIMDALAESIAEMSDEEILAEAREAGEDPERIAARVRTILRRAVKEDRPSIQCPRCGRRSSHPKDIAEQYCGFCHMFHDEMDLCQRVRSIGV
jgi:rubrerythrin